MIKMVYSQKFMEKFGDIVHQEKKKYFLILKPLYWVIDWRNRRKLTHLVSWINNQVVNASDDLIKLSKELKGNDDDKTILNILRWVNGNVKYVGDTEKWGTPEYWESAQNVYETKQADCESGSTLIFVLARLAGIPYYQLRMVAGDVYVADTNTNNKTEMKRDEEKCQKELKDFKKEIQYGIMKKVVTLKSKKDNDYLLTQNLNKVLSLGIKDKLVKILEANKSSISFKKDHQFVKDVVNLVENNSVYTTKIKTDWITMRLIWKFYVDLVMQDTMVRKEILDSLKKEILLGTKQVSGTGGHCWITYSADYDGVERIIDWCYWYSGAIISRRKHYDNDSNYISEWFSFNDKNSYGGYHK